MNGGFLVWDVSCDKNFSTRTPCLFITHHYLTNLFFFFSAGTKPGVGWGVFSLHQCKIPVHKFSVNKCKYNVFKLFVHNRWI